jgi:hypothetical protein
MVEALPLNLDRVGVLFEHRNFYFTMIPATPETMYLTTESVFRGWVTQERLGYYSLASMKWDPSQHIEQPIGLQEEWESLPRTRIGEAGVAAVGDTMGWWALHSHTVMAVRTAIAFCARDVETKRKDAAQAGKAMSDETFRVMLALEFHKVVDAVYGTLRVKEEEKKQKMVRDVADAMQRFTTLCD